jgi:prevent-host-death family protein
MTTLVNMNTDQSTFPLAAAKARFSEVVRTVRQTGRPITVTVNGEPAVQIRPVRDEPQAMTQAEADEYARRHAEIVALTAAMEPFDAVALIRDGRR